MSVAQKKYDRIVIGSVIKASAPKKPDEKQKSDYVKFRLKNKKGEDLVPGGVLTIKDGDIFSVENLKFQQESAEQAYQDKKISLEVHNSIKERHEKWPNFVRAEVILTRKNY